jgi:hypothetical protein
VVVEYLAVIHTAPKRKSPLGIYAFVRNEKIAVFPGRTILDLEKALAVGEIINPNAPMTRQEAIAKLKETKDLVDLGLVSESEFTKLREELAPLIMNGKEATRSWMVRKADGSVHGPFTESVVVEWIQQGHINASDEISIDGKTWSAFAQQPQFTRYFSDHPE